MDSEVLVDYLSSPAYVGAVRAVAFVCLIAAVVLVAICFAHYGRAREGGRASDVPWPLVVGTLRDSFLLTLLYSADTLLYRASEARSGLLVGSSTESMLFPLFAIYGGLVTQALIATIALLRVFALSKWLSANERGQR